tara:strand:- start:433 stop:1287 length:855 start_codon:yes stop_codon:yes gene_type:complete
MSKTKFIRNLAGFTVKPFQVLTNGQVLFTDNQTTLLPNQQQCEAYGYEYNQASGTCFVYRKNINLDKNLGNINNDVRGKNNITESGTNNTFMMGENNIVKGFSRNNIIAGNRNEIAHGVNNSYVYGTLAQATADNSIVLGANASGDNLAERQSIQLMYGGQTTAGGTVDSYLNNVTDSFFVVPDNTIMYFHADVVAVRVGGTNTGNTGDFASFVERGVVINKSGTLSISRERDAIKSSGTVTDWRPVANVSGANFRMTVRGETDVIVEWCSNITFTQIKTGVAL